MRFPIPKIFGGPRPEAIPEVTIESLNDLYVLAEQRQEVNEVILRLQKNYEEHSKMVQVWNDRVAADQDPVENFIAATIEELKNLNVIVEKSIVASLLN